MRSSPEPHRATLAGLRDRIAGRYPDATQLLGYGAAWSKLHSSPLVGLKGAKRYCALYVWSYRVLEQLHELAGSWDTGESTLRFSPDAPPPNSPIGAILDARGAEIMAAQG